MIHRFRTKKAVQQSQALQTAVAWVDNRLQSFAGYLSRKTEHLQPRRMAAIIMTSFFSFSVCLCFAVFRTTTDSSEMHVPAIQAPHIKTYKKGSVNEVLLQRIRHFHHQLDSLRQNDVLRYDSLMRNRPHLLDSILTVEQLSNE